MFLQVAFTYKTGSVASYDKLNHEPKRGSSVCGQIEIILRFKVYEPWTANELRQRVVEVVVGFPLPHPCNTGNFARENFSSTDQFSTQNRPSKYCRYWCLYSHVVPHTGWTSTHLHFLCDPLIFFSSRFLCFFQIIYLTHLFWIHGKPILKAKSKCWVPYVYKYDIPCKAPKGWETVGEMKRWKSWVTLKAALRDYSQKFRKYAVMAQYRTTSIEMYTTFFASETPTRNISKLLDF